MAVRLYNTLTRGLEELPPPPGPVRMYFCGPTVYQRAHIGNARPFIVGMWLRSWLKERGYDVTLVHNITDVNDKIYAAAPGQSADRAEQATAWYLEDTAAFGLGMPDHLPRATESIPGIVRFIADLIETGHAYAVDGDVYFRVSSSPDYGQLSGQRPDLMEEQEPNALKEDPRDFALWKANKPDEDTSWEAPWGRGRPGWHIECSVMAEELLGPAFEIHGGGLDLVFPHHENELAQSRALGHDFARIWMHNGMLQMTGEKMSKSTGNIISIREALDTWRDETLLLYFMTAHWRSPMDFDDDALRRARTQVDGFKKTFAIGQGLAPEDPDSEWNRFGDALDDNFNTPAALAVLHGWSDKRYSQLLNRGLSLFGLDHRIAISAPAATATASAPSPVIEIAEQRLAARQNKDFALSDELRERLAELGWRVQDTPSGYELEKT
jgi:cysteinyl-tRNA synthetase